MNIKEISISNNKKKQIRASVSDESVLFIDENGDVVVNVEAYKNWKEQTGKSPIEEIVELDNLDTLGDYLVFQ